MSPELYLFGQPIATFERSPQDANTINVLRREYSITLQEEAWISNGFPSDAGSAQKAEALLARLTKWMAFDRPLNHPDLQNYQPVLKLLQTSVKRKQELIIQAPLKTLMTLQNESDVIAIARL